MDELNRKIEENLKLQEEMKKQLAEMEEIKKNLLNSELQGLMDKRKELLSEKDKSKATLNSLKNEKSILEEKILKEDEHYNSILKELDSLDDKIAGVSDMGYASNKEEAVSEKKTTPEPMIEPVVENILEEVVEEKAPTKTEMHEIPKQPESIFEEAVKAAKSNDNTGVRYSNTFSGLKKYDEELYYFVDGLERSAEYSFNETFTKLGNFLDLFTNKILAKNNVNISAIVQNKMTTVDKLTAKINYIISNQIITVPADNVSYKCAACDEYIKTNCFTFLMMLYKTAVLPKEQLRSSYPIYNDEVMTKCLKCILFVLNRFYVA